MRPVLSFPAAAFLLVLGALATRDARSANQPAGDSPATPPSGAHAPVSARLGLAVAERLLSSEAPEDRIRGLERLGALGNVEAVDRLVRALEPGSAVARDPRARLAAVRVLAPFATRETVRQILAKTLAVEPGGAPLVQVIRDTAALALASSVDPASIEVLVLALRQGGGMGEAAQRALLAYPPVSSALLFSGKDPLPPAMSELAGELGDLRALFPLRATLSGMAGARPRAGAPGVSLGVGDEAADVRIAAALALARLGDEDEVPIARQWASSADARIAFAGLEVLLLAGASDTLAPLARLIAAKETRERALRLARRAPPPGLVPALEGAARDGNVEERRLATALLGRIGGEAAAKVLRSMLGEPDHAWNAAFALANAAGDAPLRVIEEALGKPATRRLAARAGVARALMRRDVPAGLVSVLEALLRSSDAADRAAGAFGLAALGKGDVRSYILSRDAAVARAAARASLVAGPEAITAAAERLAREPDPVTRAALSIALAVVPQGSDPVATETLRAWAEEGGPIAPLAILALGAREGLSDERRLDRFLSSPDPMERLHAALALAWSPDPDAAARLARAWQFEADASVRRALVASLARRTEPQRLAVLKLASRLDPDASAREMARIALARGSADRRQARGGPGGESPGDFVAWIAIAKNAADAPSEIGGRVGLLVTSSGLALPMVSDPDGVVIAPGLGPGAASLRFVP